MKRFFMAAVIVFAWAVAVFGQDGDSMDFSSQTKMVYGTIKKNILGAADAMPEAEYGFKPSSGEMSFGEWVAHVADSQTRYCSAVAGAMKGGDAASKKSKADLVAALKASFAVCDPLYDGLTDAKVLEMVSVGPEKISRGGMLSYNLTHDNECYGNMAVYLRLKGIVPPSTAARAAAMSGK